MFIFDEKITFAAIIISLLLASANQIFAATLTVTDNSDTNDAVCNAQCSLREAVQAASAGDTIIFARDLRGSTIELESTLQIRKRLTIDGPNKRRITIKGNNTFRVFHIDLEGIGRIATLEGLIIRDGYAANDDGGGIYVGSNVATMFITNCAVLNNTALHGGGIYMRGTGTLYLIGSTIAGNTAIGDNGAGGIDVFRSVTRINSSTISGNRSTSTIDGTGGIRLYESQSWLINSSTIADNASNGGSTLSAGGLSAIRGSAPGPIWNSILARNTGINPDYYGVSSGARNSLIGITDARSGFINGVDGSIVGSIDAPVDPQIGSLAENGGGLPTHALSPTSSAINTGNNELSIDRQGRSLAIDQRGYHRIINTTVDIGAYEFGSQPFLKTSTVNGQVTTVNGRGIFGARVILRNSKGEAKFAMTNPFGYYRFLNVASDAT